MLKTSKLQIFIAVVALAVIGFAIFSAITKNDSDEYSVDQNVPPANNAAANNATANNTAGTPSTAQPTVTVGGSAVNADVTTTVVAVYTAAQVAEHKSETSCWSIVNGSVYDLTNWITKHPGGQRAIKGMCGVDASSEFNGKHGRDKSAVAELATFKIGILVK